MRFSNSLRPVRELGLERAYSGKHETVLQSLGISTKNTFENEEQSHLLKGAFLRISSFLHLENEEVSSATYLLLTSPKIM